MAAVRRAVSCSRFSSRSQRYRTDAFANRSFIRSAAVIGWDCHHRTCRGGTRGHWGVLGRRLDKDLGKDYFPLLQTIPGVGQLSAATILAETGPDLDSFPTVEQILRHVQFSIGSVLTDVFGVSGLQMLLALLEGRAAPAEIARLARESAKRKIPQLIEAIEGNRMCDHVPRRSRSPSQFRHRVPPLPLCGSLRRPQRLPAC